MMTREEAEAKMAPSMLVTLKNYVEHHLTPGSATQAILENDLMQVSRRADENTWAALDAIVFWLYNYAPGQCWGSRERVKAWLEKKENT